jgi:hypothetical protein
LKDVWFARKKKKTVLNVAADAETWSPLFTQTQVTFDVYCYLFIAKIVSFFNNIEIVICITRL